MNLDLTDEFIHFALPTKVLTSRPPTPDDLVELFDVPEEHALLRTAYSCFPSGVTAICAEGPDGPIGMAASAFTSVSLDPPLMSVCIQNTSNTWAQLRTAPRLGVSVLAAWQERACVSLASKDGNRFDELEWAVTGEGAVLMHGATAWLDCSIFQEIPAGDHAIVLFRVHRLHAEPDIPPLIFHASGFHRLRA